MNGDDYWYEPVSLLERCSLNEALLWIWAERVPLHNVYREKNVFETLQDWECENLEIPPVPRPFHGAPHLRTEAHLRKKWSEVKSKMTIKNLVGTALEEATAAKAWIPFVMPAMELATTELFVRLKRGEIAAAGKLLPVGAEALDFIDQDGGYGRSDFDHLVDVSISSTAWTLTTIDWFANAIISATATYCDISLSVAELMSEFPGTSTPAHHCELVGNCIVMKSADVEQARRLPARPLGRPQVFDWAAFYLEVTDLIKSGRMPAKKEAAIQQMLAWFAENSAGQTPSRSAVSEKLTPFYRRFFAPKD